MRSYKVVIGNSTNKRLIRQSFVSLDEAITEMAERLDAIGELPLLDTGDFVTTEMFNERYEKRYQLVVQCPYTTVKLIKMSPGSWNKNVIRERLTFIKNKMMEAKR